MLWRRWPEQVPSAWRLAARTTVPGKATISPHYFELDLNDPVDLSYARQKVIGSVAGEEIHSFFALSLLWSGAWRAGSALALDE